MHTSKHETTLKGKEIKMTNVDLIKKEGIRVCCRIPRQVRSELNQAVKNGILYNLPKTKLAREIYCVPELVSKAAEIQKQESERTAKALLTAFA